MSYGQRIVSAGDPDESSFAFGDWFHLVVNKKTKAGYLKIVTGHPVPGSPIEVLGIERLTIELVTDVEDSEW